MILVGGDSATSNKDYVKTQHHHVFPGGVDFYDV